MKGAGALLAGGRRRAPACALVVTCAVVSAGCAPKPLYSWNEYEESLHARYVTNDPAQARIALEAAIQYAQQSGGRIPPGVCAEYGFLLLQNGDSARAIELFKQEARLFPEAKPLMDRLIAKVQEKQEKQAQQAQASPAPDEVKEEP